MMNRIVQIIILLGTLLVAGCLTPERDRGSSITDSDSLTAAVQSVLQDLHSNTNAVVEAQSIAKLDALRKKAGAQYLATAIKTTVNANRYLIKGQALSVVQSYLSGPEFDALITPTEDECTTVHMALWSGHPDKAIRMLEANPRLVTSRDYKEETPLHVSAADNQIEPVRWLLNHGADPNAEAYSKFIPIQLTTNGAVARLLIAAGTVLDHRDAWGNTPLQKAAQMGEKQIVDAILASGYSVDLRSALWLKDRERVKAILASTNAISSADENQSDLWGDVNPLGLAVLQGDVELVQLLLQAGADPKAKTERPNLDAYSSPLCVAVWGSHTNIVKLLLERGADPNILIDFRWHKWNLLDGAEKVGNSEIIRLLKEHGALRFEDDPQRK